MLKFLPCELVDKDLAIVVTFISLSFSKKNLSLFHIAPDENYFYKCPDRLRLPLIFYLAHTASVFVNKMMLAGLIDVRIILLDIHCLLLALLT